MCINEKNAGIDECIKSLIKALNNSNIETVASCCGHGKKNGIISLKNGRQLIIYPDYNSAMKYFVHGRN